MTSSEIIEKIGKPSKIIKKKKEKRFVYYTGMPRFFLAGIIWVGREQYILTFEDDKLVDILFYTSGQLIYHPEKI